jgi:hypothetical protein
MFKKLHVYFFGFDMSFDYDANVGVYGIFKVFLKLKAGMRFFLQQIGQHDRLLFFYFVDVKHTEARELASGF